MSDFLMHHGILGQKWGVRRYQNKDGSYTAEGKARYSRSEVHKIYRESKKEAYNQNRSEGKGIIRSLRDSGNQAAQRTIDIVGKDRFQQVQRQDAAIVAGSVAIAGILTTAAVATNAARKNNYRKMWNSSWDDSWYAFAKDYAANDDIAKTVSKSWANDFRDTPAKDLKQACKDKYGLTVPDNFVTMKQNLESNMKFSIHSAEILKNMKKNNHNND